MRIAVFSTRSYDREFLSAAAPNSSFHAAHSFCFFEVQLRTETLHLPKGFEAICTFVNDQLHRVTLENLKKAGVQLIALRCAGSNNVDLGMPVVRVPAYSPLAVAEHTIALILALNRKIYRAYRQVREGRLSAAKFSGDAATLRSDGTKRRCRRRRSCWTGRSGAIKINGSDWKPEKLPAGSIARSQTRELLSPFASTVSLVALLRPGIARRPLPG